MAKIQKEFEGALADVGQKLRRADKRTAKARLDSKKQVELKERAEKHRAVLRRRENDLEKQVEHLNGALADREFEKDLADHQRMVREHQLHAAIADLKEERTALSALLKEPVAAPGAPAAPAPAAPAAAASASAAAEVPAPPAPSADAPQPAEPAAAAPADPRQERLEKLVLGSSTWKSDCPAEAKELFELSAARRLQDPYADHAETTGAAAGIPFNRFDRTSRCSAAFRVGGVLLCPTPDFGNGAKPG